MSDLGLGPHASVYERLLDAYAETHRHYHTAAHIAACLDELDGARDLATFPGEVELALWFHDAVYEPMSGDNERRSAQWAQRFLLDGGTAEEAALRVYEHIMATRHEVQSCNRDSALVVDIDLAILGQPAAMYAGFERGIRAEYASVPFALYRSARCAVLRSFLAREHIYELPYFRSRYEDRARVNLRSAIQSLE